jgi:hypothetical protein
VRKNLPQLLIVLFCLSHSALAQRVAVTISPTSATVAVGKTQQFTATVTNTSDTSVEWQVNGTSGGSSSLGTISSSGLYKAPATLGSRTSVTVTAVSNDDDSKSASAVVTFTAAQPVSVAVSPTSITLQANGTQKFTATVQNTSNTTVTWQVNGVNGGSSSNGTISTSGTYTAPSNISAQKVVTVTAVSQADTTKSGTAQVTLAVANPVNVTVAPASISLMASAAQKFTATVLNSTNTSVTWQVNGVNGGSSSNGTISTNGTYTAPSNISAQKVVTVTAVSQADTSKSGSAQVTLNVANPVSVSVSPTSASLVAGGTQKFTVTVLNSSNTAVTWQVNGINGGNSTVGTISTAGNYKAPATLTAQTIVTVTAVSQADSTKSGSALVTLTVPLPVSVSVSPSSASLIGGGTQRFTATVQNASNTSVTWQVNGINGGNSTLGTISTSGNYKAPATIANQTVVSVTAISNADTTKSASVPVTLNAITVSISPLAMNLLGGAQQQFTATVQNAGSTTVTWLVNGVSGGNATIGTVSAAGLYRARATVATQTTVTVTARSTADTTKTASAIVTLIPPTPPVSVNVTPPSAILVGGAGQLFAATVLNSSNTAVTWNVNNIVGGNAAVGTIVGGLYTAPATVATQTIVTVKAVSQADTTKSASATVTINPVTISVSPPSAQIAGGGNQPFSANVQNALNPAVTWYVNDILGGTINTVGSISPAGLYSAPPSVTSLTTVTVKAISQADPTKFATASLSITPLTISVLPGAIALSANATQPFSASVLNSSNTAVNWYVNDVSGGDITTVGSISAAGLYMAPAAIANVTTVTVKAVSQADATKSATAQVSLNPLTITVSPASTSLAGGTTQPFIATLQNTNNPAVNWLVNDIPGGDLATVGSISDAGLYTAPASATAQTVVTVKAVSQADPAKSATAQVTLKPINVTVLPNPITLGGGATQNFSASVQNSTNPAVTWLVNDVPGGDLATVGSISDTGAYQSPAFVTAITTVTVKAIAQADTTKFATATVTINPITISVGPPSTPLGAAATQTFTATLSNVINTAVTWYVNDVQGGDATTTGTISDAGLYTAPAAVSTQSTVTIKATAQADSTKSATAIITLNPVAVSISPGPITLGGGATQAFAAAVQYNTNTAVIWYVNDIAGGDIATVGSISDTGLYTAPASVTAQSTVTVKAKSQADTSKCATVQITLSPVTVTVSPDASTVAILKTKQFSANVQYTTNTIVTWQVNGTEGGDDTNGHISTAGLYTAPTAVPSGAVTITAISQADINQSGSTLVTISPATGDNYYVSTTGDDTAAGTVTAPWKTISHAAAANSGVKAGDTVYVRAGVYKESVVFAISGAASPGPITFTSYPNELAIIDGTGIAAQSSPHGLIDIENQSYLTASGFEIRNYTTTSASLIPAGIWISGTGSNIQLLNNIVHDIKTSSEKNGQAYGISVYGTGALDTITIDGNQVYNLKTGGSESVNVDGNVNHFTITNNTIHDNDNIAIDAIGFEGVATNAALDYARNGVISGNTIYNISGIANPGEGNDYDADGVYVDGGTQILIERNLIHNVDIGIEAASEHKGKVSSYVTIRNNLIYNSNTTGITIGGYDSKRGGTDHCTIVNNTLYNNDTKNTASGEVQIQYYATNNVFKNNIVYAGAEGLLINSYTTGANPLDIDYNLYFGPQASTSAKFVWNGTARTGFPAFQTATGKEAHSQFLDPLFLSLTTFDMNVQPASPAVNTGIDLTPDVNGATDLDGNPRIQNAIDIGAYEQ